jgi:CHAT domain-containing protein
VFVPDGVFRNIPMATLYDGKQYLIENYRVALTPGLTLLSPEALQKKGLNTLFAGLTEIAEKPGLTPLLFVNEELDAVRSQVPSTVLLNQQFTLTDLQQTLQDNSFPIVHFATHGQFSSQFKDTFILTWNSFINILELEELLKKNDIKGTKPIELLILSACETAAGDRQAALGLAGFAVRAGARSTIATLWSVNDQASAALMGQFYRQLATQNVSKAEALRQAQLALLKNRWYRHPFYWSPYILVGNWL